MLILLTNQLILLCVWRYMRLKYATWLVEIMTQYTNYKVHTKFTWTRSVNPLCNSVNRGLTLVRLLVYALVVQIYGDHFLFWSEIIRWFRENMWKYKMVIKQLEVYWSVSRNNPLITITRINTYHNTFHVFVLNLRIKWFHYTGKI